MQTPQWDVVLEEKKKQATIKETQDQDAGKQVEENRGKARQSEQQTKQPRVYEHNALYNPPVHLDLRHLPIDNPQVVFREPQRFGAITKTRDGFPGHIRLHRTPTALTAVERDYVYRCGRTGKTRGARYQDTRRPDIYRCPFSDCDYSIKNNRLPPNSIGVHFREYHNAPTIKYEIHYLHRGKPGIYTYPEETKEGKDSPEQDKSFTGTNERPGLTPARETHANHDFEEETKGIPSPQSTKLCSASDIKWRPQTRNRRTSLQSLP